MDESNLSFEEMAAQQEKGVRPKSYIAKQQFTMSETASIAEFDERFDRQITDLLNKDWRAELGFLLPEALLNTAIVLIGHFTRGIVEAIEDQKRRRLISPTFTLPAVDLQLLIGGATGNKVAAYEASSHTIHINFEMLLEAVEQYPKGITDVTFQDLGVSYDTDWPEVYYRTGRHEIKHAVDNQAGKFGKIDGNNVTDIYSSPEEIRAIGQEVLGTPKDSPTRKSLTEILSKLFQRRREQKNSTSSNS